MRLDVELAADFNGLLPMPQVVTDASRPASTILLAASFLHFTERRWFGARPHAVAAREDGPQRRTGDSAVSPGPQMVGVIAIHAATV